MDNQTSQSPILVSACLVGLETRFQEKKQKMMKELGYHGID